MMEDKCPKCGANMKYQAMARYDEECNPVWENLLHDINGKDCLENQVKRLQAIVDRLQRDVQDERIRANAFVEQTLKLKESLENMCCQFAFWSESKGGQWTGGISALEEAFNVLGWEDPHVDESTQCNEPGCRKEATYGTPTKNGYKRLCYEHFEAAEAAKKGE